MKTETVQRANSRCGQILAVLKPAAAIGLLAVLVALVCRPAPPDAGAAPLSATAPTITGVSPSQGYNDGATLVTINGLNFSATYVKFRDNAGNVSPVATDTVTR